MVASNKLFFYLYALLFLILQTIPGAAQVKCKIEHYSTENGLSHNNVTDMLKSSDGFMWFATWDGINRFDGHNFVTYKAHQGDSMDLASNRINRLVEDYSGYLWLKPNDLSVCRFNKKTAQLLSVSSILAKAKINHIKFDKIIPVAAEKVWLTTIGQGVFCVTNAASATPVINWYAIGKEKKFALQSNNVKFVFEDKTHKIWIGTDKGLCVLSIDAKGNYYKNESINLGNSDSAFTVITETQKRIWLGTASGNIFYYEKSTGQFGNKKISSGAINAFCVSKKSERLYASTAVGEIIAIDILSVETEKSIVADETPLLNIYEDRAGLLWIEPEKNGIIKYDPSIRSFKKFTQKSDAQLKYVSKQYGVFEDNEDRVWVMMANGGFGYYDAAHDEVKYFYDEPGSPNHKFSNIIGARYFDPAGIFWFTTFDCGLEKIIFQQNDLDSRLLVEGTTNKYDNEVRGICNDHKNRMWIASKSGVLYIQQYDGKKLNNFFVNPPVGGIGSVYTILEDSKGRMWLGTKGNGLFVATAVDSSATKFRLAHFMPDKNNSYSISSDIIYSLLEDKKGRIWLGTFENGINLVKEQGNTIEFINSNNEFKDYPVAIAGKVRHLQEDAAGRLWIACNNSLVITDINAADHKLYKFISYQKKTGDKNSLANNDVQYIFKDSKNRMWLGTSGGGLNAVTEQNKLLHFKAYTKNDGLPSDYILSIAEDNKGNLWLGTENGLCKFDPDKLLVRNYDTYDGLMKESFSEGTAVRLSNGNLLFGTVSGYLVFDPEKLGNKKVNANMAFTNLQINNKDVVAGEGTVLQTDINNSNAITLKYDQNIISIDFSILDYRSNNKQVFSYRLTGFDKDWNNVVSQHRATYTNLPPGNYVFEVKSLSENLYEKLPRKTLSITILPPWWRTWWAYLAYAVLLIIIIAIVRRVVATMIRLRNKVVVEQKLTALKIKFFTNISHELRTPLTLIINPIEELIKQPNIPSKWYQYLNVAHKNANRMVRFINQLLDFQKVQHKKMQLKIAETEIVSFVKDISSYFMEVANEKQIQLAVVSNVDTLPAWIDAEKIDIVIYNLLSNAFKFSPGKTKIEVQLSYTAGNDMAVIKVVDQGPGVPADKLNEIFELYFEVNRPGTDHLTGTGIGLALSKEIIQLHHGSIVATNNADRGLTVTVQLYTSKDHFEQDKNITIITPLQPVGLNTTTVENALYPHQILTEAVPDNATELPVVLIVDDNTELRKFLAGQLQLYYKIVEASNGKEALEKANAFLPDLVLSDVMMPEMDGIALLDNLKNNEATSHIPVILLTAKSSVENQIEAINYGADYYITKPFNAPLIVALITNLLKQRKKIFKAILSGKKEITTSKTINDAVGINEQTSITDQDKAFLKEVIAIVESNMSDIEFNIEKVANSMLMGRSTFYKKLKSLTNLSPVEFIKEIRLKHSKDLLDRGQSDLTAIAYEVGFSNAKYFSACFKEEYNITPKEYLKQKIENRAQF